MARRTAATAASIEQKLARYRQSGLTSRQYCEREGIPETTLDYYRRRLRELQQRQAAPVCKVSKPALARVVLRPGRRQTSTIAVTPAKTITLVLANNRRVELAGWDCREQELARLIRLVEEA